MLTVRFSTVRYRPDLEVTIRSAVDGWIADIDGEFAGDAWQFELPDDHAGAEFKLRVERTYWQLGDNLVLPAPGGVVDIGENDVAFPPPTEVVVENGRVQSLIFAPDLAEQNVHDVIVVGSGMGGGVLAEQLADGGADVLVLEAGSYLFPTHIANLPRQHHVGVFDKHVWGLWDELRVVTTANAPGSAYDGAQGFVLGGRSVFWGGFAPRMSSYELDLWPRTSVRWDLEDRYYPRAEQVMRVVASPGGEYQQEVRRNLERLQPGYDHFDAPVAVQYGADSPASIPSGMFSTADLLTESRLTPGPKGADGLTVNLNHAVVALETDGRRVTGVVAYDLIARRQRTYRADTVVLAAGAIESPKIVQLSGLDDPSGKIGVGLTDHPILFTHFALPPDAPLHDARGSAKTLSRHRDAAGGGHPYNVVLELGADWNQGRYVDDDIRARHEELKGNTMLCELVFLFNAPLVERNVITHQGPSFAKPVVDMVRSTAADGHRGEVEAYAAALIGAIGGEPLAGGDLGLVEAGLGGVAHEVGTLRLGDDGTGVVDENLQFRSDGGLYENLYVCDLSVFPSSPAANPSLTLVAMALRLADRLRG